MESGEGEAEENEEEVDDVEQDTEEEISSDQIAKEICDELNNVSRINCTAHRLQLAIKDALKLNEASDLIKKISTIVNRGRHSTHVMDLLREAKKCLKTRNETRWNSVFYMLKSFSKLTNLEIDTILNCGKKGKKTKKGSNEELKFSAKDRERMHELSQILQELEICSDMLQGDGTTISKVLPALQTVIHKIDLKSSHELMLSKDKTVKPKHFYFEDLSSSLIDSIKSRFQDVFTEPLFAISSMLDINYGTSWIKPEDKSYRINRLKKMVEELDENETLESISNTKKKNKASSDWVLVYDDENSFTEQNFEYDLMLKKFFEFQRQCRLINREKGNSYIEPLVWWKENEKLFPTLAKLAKKFLGIPASSGSIERFFSKTGYILRQHRRQMTNVLAESLFFLKENDDSFKKLYNLN